MVIVLQTIDSEENDNTIKITLDFTSPLEGEFGSFGGAKSSASYSLTDTGGGFYSALDADSATAYRGIGVVCMSQYVLDRSKIDLLDKALEAWNASLEIQSDQEDLRRLVQKYTPKYTAPEL